MNDLDLYILKLKDNYTLDFSRLKYSCRWNITPRCFQQFLFDNTFTSTTICHSYINIPNTEIPIWRIDFEIVLGEIRLCIIKNTENTNSIFYSNESSFIKSPTYCFKEIMDTLYSYINNMLYDYEYTYCESLIRSYTQGFNKYLSSNVLISYRNFKSLCDNNLTWDGVFEIPIILSEWKNRDYIYILDYNYVQLMNEHSDGNVPDESYLLKLSITIMNSDRKIMSVPLLMEDDILDSLDTFILCLRYFSNPEVSDIKSRFHCNIDDPTYYNYVQDTYIDKIIRKSVKKTPIK